MVRIRLLVTAEHPIPRMGLSRFLGEEPRYSVEPVEFESAVQRAHEWPADVILIQCIAPEASILSVVQELRASSSKLGIVLMTYSQNPDYVRPTFAAGATAYILVQTDPLQLRAAIGAAAEGRRYIDILLGDRVVDLLLHPVNQEKKGLSARERQVLKFLAYGYTHQQIADELGVSPKTVESYRARITEKLEVKTRQDIIRYALAAGILSRVAATK